MTFCNLYSYTFRILIPDVTLYPPTSNFSMCNYIFTPAIQRCHTLLAAPIPPAKNRRGMLSTFLLWQKHSISGGFHEVDHVTSCLWSRVDVWFRVIRQHFCARIPHQNNRWRFPRNKYKAALGDEHFTEDRLMIPSEQEPPCTAPARSLPQNILLSVFLIVTLSIFVVCGVSMRSSFPIIIFLALFFFRCFVSLDSGYGAGRVSPLRIFWGMLAFCLLFPGVYANGRSIGSFKPQSIFVICFNRYWCCC